MLLAPRPGLGSCPGTVRPQPRGHGSTEKVGLLREGRPERGSYQPELEGKKGTKGDHRECDDGNSLTPAGDELASDVHPGRRPPGDTAETHIENLLVGFRRRGLPQLLDGHGDFDLLAFRVPESLQPRERGDMSAGGPGSGRRATRGPDGLHWQRRPAGQRTRSTALRSGGHRRPGQSGQTKTSWAPAGVGRVTPNPEIPALGPTPTRLYTNRVQRSMN